jgi:hypothetical protein
MPRPELLPGGARPPSLAHSSSRSAGAASVQECPVSCVAIAAGPRSGLRSCWLLEMSRGRIYARLTSPAAWPGFTLIAGGLVGWAEPVRSRPPVSLAPRLKTIRTPRARRGTLNEPCHQGERGNDTAGWPRTPGCEATARGPLPLIPAAMPGGLGGNFSATGKPRLAATCTCSAGPSGRTGPSRLSAAAPSWRRRYHRCFAKTDGHAGPLSPSRLSSPLTCTSWTWPSARPTTPERVAARAPAAPRGSVRQCWKPGPARCSPSWSA